MRSLLLTDRLTFHPPTCRGRAIAGWTLTSSPITPVPVARSNLELRAVPLAQRANTAFAMNLDLTTLATHAHTATTPPYSPNMASEADPSTMAASNGTIATEDSLSILLHQNLQHSLTLKENIENIINDPHNVPTLQTTLVKPEIWEAVIRTYTTNILTHNMILGSLEKHALRSRPEAWQDVKRMLKDAVEMVFCARRVHEHVMV
jgi:hypothetical protein